MNMTMSQKSIFIILALFLSSTTWGERLLNLLEPVGGEVWVAEEQTIRWELGGDGWTGSETLTIECTQDHGETWSSWTIDAPASTGEWPWNVASLPPGGSYQVRIECNEDTTAWDMSGTFQIRVFAGYFVNDASTDGDFFCAAPGSPTADGLTPATPNTSVQFILDTYALLPGDAICIDTGYYPLDTNIIVGAHVQGADGHPIRFLGSPHGSVLARNDTETTTVRVLDIAGHYVQIGDVDRPLHITQAGHGIYVSGTHTVVRNSHIYGCGIGAYISGEYNHISDCMVKNNITEGIRVRDAVNAVVVGNRVCDNGGTGINIWDVLSKPGLKEVIGNLVVKNGTTGIHANAPRASLHIINNTIAENGSFGLRINSLFSQYVFRNNIVCADGPGSFCVRDEAASSTIYDYNTYYTSEGALTGFYGEAPRPTMGDWRWVTQQDSNSITADPLFADPENNDYRLRSTGGRFDGVTWVFDTVSSPAIDAGDPSDPVNAETLPHGDVINQGAYGGTAEASRSPMDRVLTLIEPLHNEVYPDEGEVIVRWRCTGQGWLETDSLTIEVTSDYGNSWLLLDSNATATAQAWAWDLTGLSAAANYQLRITSNEAPAVVAASSIFRVGSGLEFYVNDTETEDVFCTAPGSPDGDGLSPSTPNTSLQFIIDTYPLQGGDIVWIDAGYYLLEDTITIAAEDAGADQNPIRFLGAPDGNTLLDRNDTESHAITINSRYIQIGDTLHPLKITGGKSGVYLNFDGQNVTIQNCEIFGCTRGIGTFYGGPFIIEDNLLHHNQIGILLSKSLAIIRHNETLNNEEFGIVCDGSAASIEENLVAENGAYGILAVNVLRNPGTELIGNQILDNGSGGVRGEAY
ncbi:MAG TPA: right-handed parallel beta-helix repeat-containing protein, partial [Candidatus Hydrogenedentes bacterium]|nr:right-handed parallel beta-helix repeat-containing protein [Candidatus Hydrogenedentota bacterium]